MKAWTVVVVGGALVLGLAGCGVSGGEASTTTAVPTTEAHAASTTTVVPTTPNTDPPVPGVDLELRPVRSVDATSDGSCGGSGPTATTTTPTTAAGAAPGATAVPETTIAKESPPTDGTAVLPSSDGKLCYSVGPAGLTGADLASAQATKEQEWGVAVDIAPARRTAANQLLDACYAADPTCPAQTADEHGTVAIALDGVVISAPSVNAAHIANRTITITGGFTEASAKELAARLGG